MPASAICCVNFERMRREMDELLRRRLRASGWRLPPRPGRLLAPSRRLLLRRRPAAGRSSRPSSPGSTSTRSRLEIGGRELVIARRAPGAGDRGPRLPADRDRGRAVPARRRARRRRGRRAGPGRPTRTASCGSSCRSLERAGEPPGADRAAGDDRQADGRRRSRSSRAPEVEAARPRAPRPSRCPRRCPVLPLKDDGRLPGHADPAGGRPGALDPARQRRARRRADARDGRLAATPSSTSPGPSSSTTSASSAVVARMLKVPDGTMRILVQATERVRLERLRRRASPTSSRGSRRCPTWSSRLARARGADPQRPAHLHRDHRADPVPARGAAARGRQRRRPVGARRT